MADSVEATGATDWSSSTGSGAAVEEWPRRGLLVSCAEVKAVLKSPASARVSAGQRGEQLGGEEEQRTVRVGETNGEGLGGRSAFGDISSDVVDPGAIRTNVRRKGHLGSDCIVIRSILAQAQARALQ